MVDDNFKTVLITGCSSGFGYHMVEDYLEAGWRVVATLRDADSRLGIFEKLRQLYPKKLIVKNLDVTDIKNCEYIVDYINIELSGKLDVLVNNAGMGLFGSLEDTSEEQMLSIFELNTFAPIRLTKLLLPALRKSKGKIFFISSIMGRYSFALASLYSASKYAIEGIVEALVGELAKYDVQVCSVQPGGHKTNFSDSLNWGDNSQNLKSPYYESGKKLKKMMISAMGSELFPNARGVAKRVVRLSCKKRIPANTVVGVDAKFAWLSKTLLPDFIYYRIMAFIGRRIF